MFLDARVQVMLPYFCSDPSATPRDMLETMADRKVIEQVFKDVREIDLFAAYDDVDSFDCRDGFGVDPHEHSFDPKDRQVRGI